MLKTLVKKQLFELFQSYFYDRKTGKARSKKSIIYFFVLYGLLFAMLFAVFFSMSSALAATITGHGIDWVYFALCSLIAMVLGIFGSVFNTYAALYLAKDNELLMSLPIPNSTILLSRLTGVFTTSLMYSGIVWIPTMVSYWIHVPKITIMGIISPIIIMVAIVCFVTVLSCFLGWIIALIAAKSKGKSFVTLFLSILFIVGYYVVYFKISNSLNGLLTDIERIRSLGGKMKSWLHYTYLLGNAAAGKIVPLIIIILITTALVLLTYFILLKTFGKLALMNNTTSKKSKTPAAYNIKSKQKALISREFKLFTAYPTWMLNGGFGILILVAGSIAIFLKRAKIATVLPVIKASAPELIGLIPAVIVLATCLIVSTDAITPVSISIEGKTLWQLQVLPVDTWSVLSAKETVSVRLNTLPAALFIVCAGYAFGLTDIEMLVSIAAVLVYIYLASDFGLMLDLKFPDLCWTNVATITKQGSSVMIYIFGGMGAVIFMGIVAFLIGKILSGWAVVLAIMIIFMIPEIILRKWLRNKGTKIFESL